MKTKEFAQWLILNQPDKFELEDDLEIFFDDFGLEKPWSYNSSVYIVRVKQWICTDSYVGENFVFLKKDEQFIFVGVTNQSARKSSVVVSYNKDNVKKFNDYLISLLQDNNNTTLIDFIDEDEEYENEYRIEYSSQILDISGQAYYENQPVKILETNDYVYNKPVPENCNLNEIDFAFRGVKILHDSTEKWVNVRDLTFKRFEV